MEIFRIKMIFSNETPSSSRKIIESDAVKRFNIEINSWQDVFETLREQARHAFNLVDNFSLYWIDEDNDLIKLNSDNHVKTTFESNGKNKNVQIFVVKNKINDFKDILSVPEVPKNKQIHKDITCDGCKNQIIGLRYVSRNVDNYDLCENCFHKNGQTHKNYVPIPCSYGFAICDDCFKEIKSGNINHCFTCKNTKVPELNKASRNSQLSWISFDVCDSCKQANHRNHSFNSESILNIYKMNKNFQNEIKSKLNNSEAVKLHFDCGLCDNCRRNGVSLRCTTIFLENVLLCTDCFLQDSLIHYMNFRLLSDDEAQNFRNRIIEIQRMEREFSAKQLQSSIEMLKISGKNIRKMKM